MISDLERCTEVGEEHQRLCFSRRMREDLQEWRLKEMDGKSHSQHLKSYLKRGTENGKKDDEEKGENAKGEKEAT